jgi:dTDP-4-amino-4,6-dideoxygalactose transaminase
MIRLTVPSIDDLDIEAVREVLKSGFLVQGPRVAAFEAAMAEVVGSAHAIAVSSGTAALHVAMLALGVERGDRVAVPAYSFPATANVVEICGAEPVFVDIEAETFAMDPARLVEVAAERGPLKAVIPVHPFGQMADIPRIAAAAGRAAIVEDAAAALGASLHGRRAGSLGLMGCFSFHPRKAVTTGEGGVIVTSEGNLARALRSLRSHGQDPETAVPNFVRVGLNYRMTEFQAALGVTQLAKLESIVEGRKAAAARYDSLLYASSVRCPVVRMGSDPVFQSYVVLLPEDAPRDAIVTRLRERGIETQIGTWHLPLLTYYRDRYGYKPGDFPVTDSVFARTLTLPLHAVSSQSEQAIVVRHLLAAL